MICIYMCKRARQGGYDSGLDASSITHNGMDCGAKLSCLGRPRPVGVSAAPPAVAGRVRGRGREPAQIKPWWCQLEGRDYGRQ